MLLGKEHQVRLAFSCLLAGGHLLIEDRPGMGKSTLAEALARVFALDVTVCPACGGRLRLIAALTDPASVRRYLQGV